MNVNEEADLLEALIHALNRDHRSFSFEEEAIRQAFRAINERLAQMRDERLPGLDDLPELITVTPEGRAPGWSLALRRLPRALQDQRGGRLRIVEAGSYSQMRLQRLFPRPEARDRIYELCLLLPDPRPN